MPRKSTQSPTRALHHGLRLPKGTVEEMRAALPAVAERTVAAIIDEVPSYADALAGPMGANIRNAVQLALGGFISLAARTRGADPRTPAAPAMEGAYQLGRGEARSGRSMDALLAAYRIGARTSWREMSASAVRAGMDTETLAAFAELVFAYIDQLSAASAAGHAEELATSGRVLERLLQRIALGLVEGSDEDALRSLAEQAGWRVPTTLTAVLAPAGHVRTLQLTLPAGTLLLPGEDGSEVQALLVPDAHDAARQPLLRQLGGTTAVAGPARPWLEAAGSLHRATRALALGVEDNDADAHLARIVQTADPTALADLRAQVLAPLARQRPATAEKLADTLRAWLLHGGRRDEVAAALFVHPQTVRYRMGQLRDLYGERLTDPGFVRDAVMALA